jgi:hypothetical protein
LLAADVHLITLRDAFVGYVLPSKIYACIESGRRILFVGSHESDVHVLAESAMPSEKYHRIPVGDVDGLVIALHEIESRIVSERVSQQRSSLTSGNHADVILCRSSANAALGPTRG